MLAYKQSYETSVTPQNTHTHTRTYTHTHPKYIPAGLGVHLLQTMYYSKVSHTSQTPSLSYSVPWLRHRRDTSSIPGQAGYFSWRVHTPNILSSGYQRVKRSRCVATCSPAPVPQVKKNPSYTSTPLYVTSRVVLSFWHLAAWHNTLLLLYVVKQARAILKCCTT